MPDSTIGSNKASTLTCAEIDIDDEVRSSSVQSNDSGPSADNATLADHWVKGSKGHSNDVTTDGDSCDRSVASSMSIPSQRQGLDGYGQTGIQNLHANGVAHMGLTHLQSQKKLGNDEKAKEALVPSHVEAGSCIPVWCSFQESNEGGFRIVPCVKQAEIDEGQAAGCCHQLWCWVQQIGGEKCVVPMTDFTESGDTSEPPSEAELACAPPPPAEGSHVPEWSSGPCWPFNRPPTTLTLNNLPGELTPDCLLEVLDKLGFSGFYDFVFLSTKERQAIVNLIRHEYGLALAATMHQFKNWGNGIDNDACEVSWSLPLQGFSSLVAYFHEHPLNASSTPQHLRPLVFSKGWPVPFPELTPQWYLN